VSVNCSGGALADPVKSAAMIASLCVAAVWARLRTAAAARDQLAMVRFDDVEAPELVPMGLRRDGRIST
jgi:hypothetical protein